jgi:hypothetical protein
MNRPPIILAANCKQHLSVAPVYRIVNVIRCVRTLGRIASQCRQALPERGPALRGRINVKQSNG